MYTEFRIEIERKKSCWHVEALGLRPDDFGDTYDFIDEVCLTRFKPLADDPFVTWIQIVAHLQRARDTREWMP